MDLFGSTVSTSTTWRMLHAPYKMGCSRQALRYIASQQSELARAQFMAEISVYDPSMFIMGTASEGLHQFKRSQVVD